jgi:hypothetical protein
MKNLKNNQSEINNSKSQINIIIESLVNRMEQLKIEYWEQKTKRMGRNSKRS